MSLAALFLAGLCLPTFLLAAGFVGNVTDASGALIVGATVKARNLDTQREETVLTNGAGAYRFAALTEGRYQLTIAKDGFRPQTVDSLVLRVGEELRLDATLSPGNQETNLAISASPVPLATETATLATVVDTRNIQELPLNGRQLQNLALLSPGIAAGWNWSTAANRYGKARENTEGAFNVNGLRGRSNNFVFDGAPMNVQQYGVINFEPSNETVREFSLVSSTPEAEYGGTLGATVNIVTRSGTSQFHGALYEFFRNDVLDANSTFAKAAGLERGKLRQNQYGGNLGGPLFSKRHFFFGNFEQLRILEGVETRLVSVPTAQERQGLLRYRDAAGATQTLNLANRLNPISRRLLDFYPAPNTGGDNALNYASALTIGLTDTQYHIRTDHYLTGRDQVMVRFSRNNNDQEYIINRFGGPYIPGFSLPNPEKTIHAVASHLHTFSSAMFNEFRAALNRYANDLGNGDPSNAEAFGLPNGNGSANGIPSLTFAGNAVEPLGGLTWFNRIQNETTTSFADTLSLLRGRHHLKFGGSFSRRQFNTRGASNQRGTISFDGSRNGLIPRLPGNERSGALADFLLGQPFEASIVVGAFGRGYRQTATAFFVQDSWRATPRLTVNLGLRCDYSAPWTEVNGKLSNLAPDGTLALVGTSALDRLYQPDRNNFAPRLGLAYDLRGNGETVLRAGLAYTYETLLQANSVQQVENNPPFSAFAVTRSPSPFPATGNATTLLDLRNQAQPSRSIAAVDSQAFRNPYAAQWNFSLQQRLANVWLLELAYVGTRGQALPYFFNANQVPLASLSIAQRNTIASAIAAGQDTTPLLAPLRPYPAFDTVTLSRNAAQSTYHSGQIKLERRFSRGLSVLASHTWAKSIDNASDFGSGDPSERILNSSNLALQRGPSSFDVQHRFTSAFTWELPCSRGWLLDGWQVNGVVTLQTGQPFTPFNSNFDPFRNEAFNRPDVVGDPQANIPAGLAFNPAAFRNPAPGTFGNAGRNIVRGDGFQSFDLSAFKNFALTESLRLQFRAEAVNAFNTVNFQGPVVNLNTTPGRWVAAAQPRILQLGLKLSF
ncbi:MAG: TonB-dependent receptor [Bryobacter sp.]|nr:TonB-dependent receptor [Bryobacter sp.]